MSAELQNRHPFDDTDCDLFVKILSRCAAKYPGANINFLALGKGNEHYIFLCDDNDKNIVETRRQIGHFAASPELSLTWYDAAIMSQKIRQTASDCKSVLNGDQTNQKTHPPSFPISRISTWIGDEESD